MNFNIFSLNSKFKEVNSEFGTGTFRMWSIKKAPAFAGASTIVNYSILFDSYTLCEGTLICSESDEVYTC